jgi:oxygen-independent coproporphyrinogen-3 oxidase
VGAGPLKPLPLGVYLHFPWCVRKCPYCDFNSFTLRESLPEDAYIEALLADLAAQCEALAGREVASVFLGGGTPSLFSPAAIGRVLERLAALLPLAPDVEVTLEANPATIERGRFAAYRVAGINRVSLGAQTFDPAALAALGRIHSPADVYRSVDELRACGLDNFNLDLMFALPGQTVDAALEDLGLALSLEPAHLSHYQLTLEPGTVFAGRPPVLPSEDDAWAMQQACHARLADAGFQHYEVSAFARPGHRCRHNLNYWAFGDYLGAGAGAHGKLTGLSPFTITRTTLPREPRRYLANPQGGLVRQTVPAEDRCFEFMLNSLRLVDGFTYDQFESRTGLPRVPWLAPLQALAERGLMALGTTGACATPRGQQYLNEVVAAFLPDATQTSRDVHTTRPLDNN